MSSDSSTATKVLIGCLIAFVAGVLICAGAIVLVGYATVGFVQQVDELVDKEVARNLEPQLKGIGELLQLGQVWIPPSPDAGADDLLPLSVTPSTRPQPGQAPPGIIHAWNRASHDDSAAIPELALDQDGRHARYEANGAVIDVCIYQVPAGEQSQVFADAVSAIQGAGYSSQTHHDYKFDGYDMVRWMTFSFAPPQRHGRMLWVKDWLIVTMTDRADVDLEGFEHAYLLYIQGKGEASAAGQVPAVEPVPAVAPAADVPPVANDAAVTAEPIEPPAPSRSDRQAQ